MCLALNAPCLNHLKVADCPGLMRSGLEALVDDLHASGTDLRVDYDRDAPGQGIWRELGFLVSRPRVKVRVRVTW